MWETGKVKPLVPFLLHMLLLNWTFSMGKVFKSETYSTGVQLGASPQEVIRGWLNWRSWRSKRGRFAKSKCKEGWYRRRSTRLSSERHEEDARGNSHDLKQGKFITKQGPGLDTANVPFHSRSFCDSWVFPLMATKPKYLQANLNY